LVGSSKKLLKDAGPDSEILLTGERSEFEELRRSGILAEIKANLDLIPLDRLILGGFSDNLEDDIFMETLVNNLKNDCVSYQTFISRTIKNTISQSLRQLEGLKKDHIANQDAIFDLEKKLNRIQDRKMRSKLEGSKNFEILNNEKITPNFINLSKGSKSEACLSDLKNSNGQDFACEDDMKNYVRDFYQKLYKSPESDSTFNDNCIEDFLGEEILNSRLVLDSKIPPDISENFENPLSIEELDKSANQGNRSASGRDGLSNCFIKKYWDYLRVPLHRYATCCHAKGKLTQNFSSATIKLIPKKGDITQLKNWRPISLLSCLYKVISRALNNRLKQVTGFIFSRAQKGFTSDRHIQEVLMNVIEMIAHCNRNGIPGAILSIDQAKAFDSVSHKYMRQVYRFFGFGPNFIRLLETLGNDRTACIAFEDGTYSADFELKCGRAQGNTSSPTEYNMGQQILLFKIELCPEIKSLYQSHFISRPIAQAPVEHFFPPPPGHDRDDPRFRNESSFETAKCDGFADDNTAGTLFEFESLNALKITLELFAGFSGLRCNTDKTVIMQVGHKIPISDEITGLGFNFADSIHILGMEIDSELARLDCNFDKTVNALKKSIDYWDRYYLTLPGRINVIKSLLFPLVLYLGCFIMPSTAKIKMMQDLLDNYAVGKLNFSKKRITVPQNQGGLGLFDIEKFLTGQQAGWVLKAHKSSRDNWRAKLRALSYGNVLCSGPNLISPIHNPILHGLATSYEKFRLSHDQLHSNSVRSFIINNKMFTRGRGDNNLLDVTYLELDDRVAHKIASMTAMDFFNVNGLKSRVELLLDSGVMIPVPAYVKIAASLNHFVRKMKPNNRSNGSSRFIVDEFIPLKNPGKKIRASLTKKSRNQLDVSKIKSVLKFQELSQTSLPCKEILGTRISLWNFSGITNRVRTFFFKFFNNILGLNTRISHFVPGQSRDCTFCLGTFGPISEETFIHLFYECPTTTDWHEKFLRKYFTDPENLNRDQKLNFFFNGLLPGTDNDNSFVRMAVYLFQYCIWEERLSKKKSSFGTLDLKFTELLRALLQCNRKVFLSAESINIPMCRFFGATNNTPAWTPAPARPLRRQPP
jgi:hypothetical protein